MRNVKIFLYEWKHFLRNPFKIIAVLLFTAAAIYGLQNGSNLYKKQTKEVEKIQEKIKDEKQKYLTQYKEGKLVPENRSWVDMSTPFWAIWYTPTHHIKKPSSALVYNIGQAEQYGFYKRITFWASPYDADMAEEIANPERLQIGTLDFNFVLLFLLPLLLLILLYNLKSVEAEQGFLPLIEVQTASNNSWLISRILFYIVLSFLVMFSLLMYGATLTNVFEKESNVFGQILLYAVIYLLFWSVIYFLILRKGNTILGNTLQMIGVWLLFAFIIPGVVHQVVSIVKPANLMTDFIEVRDKQQELYNEPDSIYEAKLIALYPEIKSMPVFKDSLKFSPAMNRSAAALVNELKKESLLTVEQDNKDKNKMIENTFWFNPVSFFQNKFNKISKTHFNDYQKYRDEIQEMIDKRTKYLVLDTWSDVKVDEEKYMEYFKLLSKN